jgi:pimeloyl-ACP methyl ester carboxylesterase
MTEPRTPVVFIHGLWLHTASWTPWLELFAQAGYDPVAPGWPGEPDTVEQARQQPELVANTSIDDITAHYTKIIDALDASPVIIGHSFGRLIAEKLLGQGTGTAAVAIDPAQIKGVLPLPLTTFNS